MRQATIHRRTQETDVHVELTLEGEGRHMLETGVPFLDHMLSHVAVHGLMDVVVRATGDTHIDAHHTVEDIGICFGQALRQALGDKSGIKRYAHQVMPMDEALIMLALDISGRGLLIYDVMFSHYAIGSFDTELVREFLNAFATNAGITLHVRKFEGINAHHLAEAIFKALGRCLGEAVAIDPARAAYIPSTKGTLE